MRHIRLLQPREFDLAKPQLCDGIVKMSFPHVVLDRTRDLKLITVSRTPRKTDLARIAGAQGLKIVPEENTEAGWYYRSDHYALAQKGVPGV